MLAVVPLPLLDACQLSLEIQRRQGLHFESQVESTAEVGYLFDKLFAEFAEFLDIDSVPLFGDFVVVG